MDGGCDTLHQSSIGEAMTAVLPERNSDNCPPSGEFPHAWGHLGRSLRALLVLLLLVAARGLWAVESPAPEPAPAAVALAHRTRNLQEALRSGREESVETVIHEIDLLRREYGALDVRPLVDAMALWARTEGEAGRVSLGLKALDLVDRWAPRDTEVLSSRVVLLRQQGLEGYFRSLPEVLELTRIRLAHPTHRWLWAVQHIGWLRLMVTVLLWGWVLALGLRYRRVLRDSWEDFLRRRGMHGWMLDLAGALTLAFPVMLGLDPSIAAMVWLFLLAPFLAPAEVKLSVALLMLQLCHPALALLEPRGTEVPLPSLVALQQQPRVRAFDGASLALPASDLAFLKGWQCLQDRRWAEAEGTFQDLEGKHPDQAEVLNNLGVAKFQLGQVEAAQKLFDRAFGLAPKVPQILINQSVIAFRQLDSAVGLAKQDESNALAPDLHQQIMSANQARTEQRTFPLPLPDSPERDRALARSLGMAAAGSVSPLQGAAFLWNLAVPLIALGLFLFRIRRSFKVAHPVQCIRCGDPFHTTDSPDVGICSKCHHLFVLKDGIHNESRKRKVEDVATFQREQRWIHRALVVLLPGADLCFLGESREGFMELLFLCMAAGMVFATGRSVRFPGDLLPDPASTWLPIGLGLLGILFLRSWLKLIPRRS